MIDIHTHLHPPKLFAAIRRWFAERSDWDLSKHPTEPGKVAAILRAEGIERFVFFSYAHKPGIARELNAWLTAISRELGGFGLPLATVHLDDGTYADDARIALEAGCIGLKLHEDVQHLAVDDIRFDPVYRALVERGAFLLVHVGPIPWAYPPDAGAARVKRVLDRYPGLNVVVAHLGVPDTTRYFELMERHPRLHLDTTMVLAAHSPVGGSARIDAALVERHADRVLYGTDFPNVPHPYAEERKGIEQLGLSAAALRSIFHDNAARLIADAGAGEAAADSTAKRG
jgi:hypothetical protein